MGFRPVLLLFALIGLVFAVGLSEGHGAAPAVEPWKRVAEDCNDDWGGHEFIEDGHDLITLEVTERYYPPVEDDVVVFHLLMNGGYNDDTTKPTLKETFTIVSPSKTVRATIETTDNARFAGTGTPSPAFVRGPLSAGDGTRFWLEVAYRYADLGVQPGQQLSGLSVQGWAGSHRADFLPGGFTTYGVTGQETHVRECPLNQTTSEVYYPSVPYDVVGSAKIYFELTAETTTVNAGPASNNTRNLTIKNKLTATPQQVTITVDAPAGWGTHAMPNNFSLAPSATAQVMVHLFPGEEVAAGPARVTVQTNQGGFHVVSIPLNFSPGTASAPPTDTTSAPAAKKGLPAFETVLVLFALLAAGRIRS